MSKIKNPSRNPSSNPSSNPSRRKSVALGQRQSFFASIANAGRGFRLSLQDRGVMLSFILFLLCLGVAVVFHRLSAIVLFANSLLILLFELSNATIERLCDRITTDYDEDIRAVKDMASAPTLVLCITHFVLFVWFVFSVLSS